MRSWIVTTRRKRPQPGAVLARLWSRSTPRARGQPRQQLLLAADPLDRGCARAPERRTEPGQLAPRAAGRGRLAVDERGEAVLGRGGDELGDQLPGVGLHAPGLARDEEDEVQADVHRARRRISRAAACAVLCRRDDAGHLRPLTIGIDARAATEVPAGRGRVVRELLRALAERDDSHRYVCYAASALVRATRRALRLAADRGARPALACACRPRRRPRMRRLPGHELLPQRAAHPRPSVAIVYDLVTFDRATLPNRRSQIDRAADARCGGAPGPRPGLHLAEQTRSELIARFPAAAGKASGRAARRRRPPLGAATHRGAGGAARAGLRARRGHAGAAQEPPRLVAGLCAAAERRCSAAIRSSWSARAGWCTGPDARRAELAR